MSSRADDANSGDESDLPGLRWSVERRLAFIEQRLFWEGRINRSDIVARFGISPNQATSDLRRFETARPGAMVYDPRIRAYRAGPALQAADDGESAALLRELRLIAEGLLPPAEGRLTAPPPLGLAEAPVRRVDPIVLQAVLGAIRDGRALQAVYRSFSSPMAVRRTIEPHALVFDGFRWHARARDGGTGLFKDFVLGRLSEPEAGPPAAVGLAAADVDWQTMVTLVLEPHPALAPHQRIAVELDYGMSDGRLSLTCRRALVWYLRRRLGLLPGHRSFSAFDQHIVLVGSE